MKTIPFAYLIVFMLFFGCENDLSTVIKDRKPMNDNPAIPDFEFYPADSNAMWIIKSKHGFAGAGIFYFLDTIVIGKDTVMVTKGTSNNTLSEALYHELITKSMSISFNQDTGYDEYRYGWFRIDKQEKKFYYPFNESNGVVKDRLLFDFSLNKGDTINARGAYVREIIYINFGEKQLKQFFIGNPSYNFNIGRITQGIDIAAGWVGNSSSYAHPGSPIWKKFIFYHDTLYMNY